MTKYEEEPPSGAKEYEEALRAKRDGDPPPPKVQDAIDKIRTGESDEPVEDLLQK